MSTIKLAVPMPAESAAALRAPFPPEKVGKLPKVTCSGCRDARSRVCDKHRKSKCTDMQSHVRMYADAALRPAEVKQ